MRLGTGLITSPFKDETELSQQITLVTFSLIIKLKSLLLRKRLTLDLEYLDDPLGVHCERLRFYK